MGSQLVLDSLEPSRGALASDRALSASFHGTSAGTPSQRQALERRKYETASSVIVIEALSQTCPIIPM